MKKIAIFAIFLMATIMTFGQLVPDEQYLPTCSVKSTSTNFTKFIPKNTTVKVGTSQYILLADGGVGNSLSKMLLLGTAEVDPCCGSTGTVSATSTTTTINNDSVIIGNGTGAIGIFPGTLTVRGLATLAGGASIAGHLFSRYDANGIHIGSSFHAGDTLFGKVLYGTSMRLGYGIDSTNIILSPKGIAMANPQTSSTQNVIMGGGGTYLSTAGYNVLVGIYSGSQLSSGQSNVLIGAQSGGNISTQHQTVSIGTSAGAIHPGNSCIYIGTGAGESTVGDNRLVINNASGGQDTAIIYGVMNDTPASNTLEFNAATTVNGSLIVKGTFTQPANVIKNVATPKAFDSTGTATAAIMLRGVIKSNSASAVSMTTPSAATILSSIAGGAQGTSFDLIIDNQASSSAGIFTLVLDGTITVAGVTITGENTLTVPINQCAKFTFYTTSGSSMRCYRVF